MSRAGRTIALVFVATLGVLVAPAGTTAAGADPIGSCTTTTGAIVAVDFAHWGGPVVRGCGVNQRSGYALLHAAGFTTAGDAHDGPGFICRIGNQAYAGGAQYPTTAQDPCVRTPPVSAYWSYWHAAAGQSSWSYGTLGATTEVPTPGEVELWLFGGTDLGGTTGSAVPTFTPDALRAHNASPTVVTVPASGARPATPTTRATVNTASGVGPAPSTPPPSRPEGPASTASTHPSASAVTSSTTDAGPALGTVPTRPLKLVDALPAAPGHSSGSAVPLLVGLSLVIVLSGSAAGTTWRRRQRD